MAKNNNLTDLLKDVANAIREKKGTTSLINPQDFSAEIASIAGGGSAPSRKWTGHADAEGLRAIGWTDDDIAYYQQNGVNWDEEYDEYHKVSDDNKALYGALTVDNIQDYKDRIVYLPKIDVRGVTDMSWMFNNCVLLVCIPCLDTRDVTNMFSMFNNCYSLVTIPMLDTSNVTDMSQMFRICRSLVSVPLLDTANVTNMNAMFDGCYSLASVARFNTQKVTCMSGMFNYCYSLTDIPQFDTRSVTNMASMFYYCRALVSISALDMDSVTSASYMFDSCSSLAVANIKNVKFSSSFHSSAVLSKEALLCIINNEAATSAITITLNGYAYSRLATDAEVVSALANHTNVSLASA